MVFRGGTVLPMDDSRSVLADADVLVVGERIEAVGPHLPVPDGHAGDRRVRRHRHAGHDRHPPAHVADRDARLRRRLDPHPVLRLVLPRARQDVPAAGHPRRQPARRHRVAGRRRDHHRRLVARAADHRARRRRGGRAAGGAGPLRAGVRQHPGRPVGVVGGAGVPGLRQPADHPRRRHARLPDGLRRHRRPGVPGEGRVRGGPRPRRPGHHARRRLGRDQRRRHPAHATSNGFATPRNVYVHAATLSEDSYQRIAASGGSVSVSTESEQSAGQGYPPTWTLRSYDIPVSLSMDTSVWWSGDLFSAMRDHARRRPVPGALRGARQGRHGDQLPPARGPGRRVGHPGRGQGARPGRRRRPARARPEGRRRADQERPLAGDVPAAQPVRARGLPGPARRRAHRRWSTAGS